MTTTYIAFCLAATGVLLLLTVGSYLPAIIAAIVCFIGASITISGAKFPGH